MGITARHGARKLHTARLVAVTVCGDLIEVVILILGSSDIPLTG